MSADQIPQSDPIADEAAREAEALGETDDDTSDAGDVATEVPAAAPEQPAQAAPAAPAAAVKPAKAAQAKQAPKGKPAPTKAAPGKHAPAKARPQPQKAASRPTAAAPAASAPAAAPALQEPAPGPDAPAGEDPAAEPGPRRLRASLARIRKPDPESTAQPIDIGIRLPAMHELPAGGYCARHIDVRLEKEDAEFVKRLAFNLEVATEGKVSPQKAVAWLIREVMLAQSNQDAAA